MGEVVALSEAAPDATQQLVLLACLDAFGHCPDSEVVCQLHNGLRVIEPVAAEKASGKELTPTDVVVISGLQRVRLDDVVNVTEVPMPGDRGETVQRVEVRPIHCSDFRTVRADQCQLSDAIDRPR